MMNYMLQFHGPGIALFVSHCQLTWTLECEGVITDIGNTCAFPATVRQSVCREKGLVDTDAHRGIGVEH